MLIVLVCNISSVRVSGPPLCEGIWRTYPLALFEVVFLVNHCNSFLGSRISMTQRLSGPPAGTGQRSLLILRALDVKLKGLANFSTGAMLLPLPRVNRMDLDVETILYHNQIR